MIDLLWGIFTLVGIEHSGELLASSYIPWSHDFVMAIVWSILAGLIVFFISKDRRASTVIGLVVLSHWILDFIADDLDPPLFFDTSFLGGLGIEWTHTPTGLVIHWAQARGIEFGLFIVGFLIYWMTRKQLAGQVRENI